ncbi:hypothetical protein [Salibacter sp.]|jgi:hypothetical protein|uniref:hypothetical protein n=1 Tax=Salibacter sp. TaxID=2010995 RepID=UPI0028706F48|nr:hypothetical protein [Salibacter sp.]MDR9399422.1 hypothetical protein [Salibacter sp.]MDR9486750.1 hypothetical protein [Salibacter sp.]
MTWNELIYAIGDFVTLTFELLKAGNNYVNWFFIVLIAIVLTGWVVMQQKYNKEAKENGTLM